MRFNEKELVSLSRQPSEMAAELGMRGPKKGDGKMSFYFCFHFMLYDKCFVDKRSMFKFIMCNMCLELHKMLGLITFLFNLKS